MQNYFRRHAPCESAPYGISPEVMDTYVKSCGMCKLDSPQDGCFFFSLKAIKLQFKWNVSSLDLLN